jgi:hypothetical protein
MWKRTERSSHLTRPPTEAASAAAVLGADHPLVRALDRLELLLKQSAAAGVLLFTVAVAAVAGVPDAAAFIVAAVVVQVALALGLLIVAAQRRERARDLIIDGRAGLPLAAVDRERQRLLSSTCRRRLADSLDDARELAASTRWLSRSSRPLFRSNVVAAADPQLAEIAARLRSDEVEAVGVALMWRLLFDGGSPLYGDDVAPLGEALDLVARRLGR